MFNLAIAVVRSLEATEATSLGGHEGPDLTRYLVVCSLLVVGVAGLAFGLKRTVGRSMLSRAKHRSLRIVDVLPMGGRKRMAVVQCYDRTFLIGCGEREFEMISELDAGEVLNKVPDGVEVPRSEHPAQPVPQPSAAPTAEPFRKTLERSAAAAPARKASDAPKPGSFQPQRLAELMREKGILG